MSLKIEKTISKKATGLKFCRMVLSYPCGEGMALTGDFFDQTYKHVHTCRKCEAEGTLRNTKFQLGDGRYVKADLIKE